MLALALLAVTASHGQRLEFEAASVKHNPRPESLDTKPRRSGDLVTMRNAPLYLIFTYAYNVSDYYKVVGFQPPETDWFDVDARIGRDATDDEVRRMMQSLLEDRFALKVHRETRELAVYELVVGKGKPHLTVAAAGEPLKLEIEGRNLTLRNPGCGVSLWTAGSRLICHASTMDKIAAAMGNELHAPVLDHTGLTARSTSTCSMCRPSAP